ncbi:hypothetical protein [Paenibacillus odorifer]|uniref:hypothetical protein n=1 Tax=Paenibacillus odorifer TaxID=189426 RepID=UPI00096C75E0|nr:hypothetical protein [Paenibacillus odorifer]OME27753.1 hypothetical protein BSK57_03825 [Paenibacillus odorifer]
MKRQLILLSIVMTAVLSSCSNSSTPGTNKPQETTVNMVTPTEQQGIVETTVQPTEQHREGNDPEGALKEYLDTLMAKNYDKLTSLLYAENLSSTPEQLVAQMKENDFKNSIERTDYMISSITDYDDTHKLGKIILRGTEAKETKSADDSLGLILINGEWKVDLSLIVKSETEDVQIKIPNEVLTLTKITKITKYNGYQIIINFRNNLLEKYLLVGYGNSTAVLNTDKGSVTAKLNYRSIEPQTTDYFSINFETPEKCTSESLIIKGLRIGDSNNLPSFNEDPFSFEVQL